MKLKLQNFRCYENKEYDFGEKGLSLLSGGSGAGKTSILMAIEYALFGGQQRKIVMHGKKTCTVELQLNDLKIIRTNSPHRLIVSQFKNNSEFIYEDASGQSLITSKFGKLFNSVSYIPQNLKETFVLMSPMERLTFLEDFAFNSVDINEIKIKAKEEIKKVQLELERISGNLENATRLFNTTEKPKIIKYPVVCEENDQEEMHNKIKSKLQNCVGRIKKSNEQIKLLEKETEDIKILQTLIAEKEDTILQCKTRIENEAVKLEEYKRIFCGEDNLILMKSNLKKLILNRENKSFQLKYEDNLSRLNLMKSAHMESLSKRIDEINSNLWTDMNENEVEEQITFWTELVEMEKNIKTLSESIEPVGPDKSQELKDVQDQLKVLSSQLNLRICKCPHCFRQIKINKEFAVQKYEDDKCEHSKRLPEGLQAKDIEREMIILNKKQDRLSQEVQKSILYSERNSDIQNKIANYRKNIAETLSENPSLIDEISIQYENILQYKTENKLLEKEKNLLSSQFFSKSFPVSIVQFEKTLSEDFKKINSFPSCDSDETDENDLQEKINFQTKTKETVESLSKNISLYENDIKTIKIIIDNLILTHCGKYQTLKSLPELNALMEDQKKINCENEEKKEHTFLLLCKIEKYKENKKWVDNWLNIKNQKEDLELQEKLNKDKYTAALIFKEKVLEAESISILNIIHTINSHVHHYLNYFFPDNPINIQLCAYKDKLSGASKGVSKPQINLEILYKGIDHDLNMLSGGELSRVILAFTLALAEIQSSPIILLDECTSSLDQELTLSVIEGLKENFGEKLVLLIAHQVIEGSFDKVVKLQM